MGLGAKQQVPEQTFQHYNVRPGTSFLIIPNNYSVTWPVPNIHQSSYCSLSVQICFWIGVGSCRWKIFCSCDCCHSCHSGHTPHSIPIVSVERFGWFGSHDFILTNVPVLTGICFWIVSKLDMFQRTDCLMTRCCAFGHDAHNQNGRDAVTTLLPCFQGVDPELLSFANCPCLVPAIQT